MQWKRALQLQTATGLPTHDSEDLPRVTRSNNYLQEIENMVARDGVEPPPAFSGLRSTVAIYFNNKHFIPFSVQL